MSLSLCLYVCCKHRPLYQNQIFKIPVTFYNARCRCSVLLWSHWNSHVFPGLWMTSCFRVMTKSQNVLSSWVCSSVCLSQAGVVSKRLNGLSWFLYRSFVPLCCKEVRVSHEIRVFRLQLCPKFYTWLEKFRHRKSIVLSTKFMDGRACWPLLRQSMCS